MERFRLVDIKFDELLNSFSYIKSEDELNRALHSFSSFMGFSQHRLAVIIPNSLSRPTVAIFSNCNEKWVDIYNKENLLYRDPVIYIAMRESKPIFWKELSSFNNFKDKLDYEFMDRASDFGLKNGISFPLRGGKGEFGILSFITNDVASHELINTCPFLRLAGDYIFNAAVGIIEKEEDNELSSREIECLFWASEGKTATEIGLILGISPRTVTYYIQGAILKTSSVNRYQAIAKVAACGLLLPNISSVRVKDISL
jgi:DNA-binding CsgD family transcriptional regulator